MESFERKADDEKYYKYNIFPLLRNREFQKKPSRVREAFQRSEYSVQTLDQLKRLHSHAGCVNTVNFNETGDLLVTGSDDQDIRIWNVNTGKCLNVLGGHQSNVFAANFIPYCGNTKIVSGGNDADVRFYDLVNKNCTVYAHHTKKVLRITINPAMPDSFMSCSADGTVRMFDTRVKYNLSTTTPFDQEAPQDDEEYVIPQALGGGKARRAQQASQAVTPNNAIPQSVQTSLVLDYKQGHVGRPRFGSLFTLFYVDFHPHDGHSFIVGSVDGHVRLFDLRYIKDHSSTSFVNIYRNMDIEWPPSCEVTGCAFSKDGTEIVASSLNDFVYVYDVNTNFTKEFNVDYFAWRRKEEAQKKKKKRTRKDESHKDDIKRGKTTTTKEKEKEETPQVENEEEKEANTEEQTDSNENGEEEEHTISLALDTLDFEFIMDYMSTDQDADRDIVSEYREYRASTLGLSEPVVPNDKDEEDDISDDDFDPDYNTSDDEEEQLDKDEEKAIKQQLQTYKGQYKGHISYSTIKGVSFYGPNSEFVMSGSDDSNVYIWNKRTGNLVRILEGHDSIVNCVTPHPFDPIIATSGIDSHAILWGSIGPYPDDEEVRERAKMIQEKCNDNAEPYDRSGTHSGGFCTQQ